MISDYRYAYERARQAAILVREVTKFRKDIGHEDWPCIISGGKLTRLTPHIPKCLFHP